jgi:hypothetical protein
LSHPPSLAANHGKHLRETFPPGRLFNKQRRSILADGPADRVPCGSIEEKQVKATLRISAIALAVALLTAVPVSAASINIGGNGPLLGVGGSTNDPTATVAGSGNGGVLGGDSLLGIGGSDTPTGNATTNLLDNNGGPTTADVTLGNTPATGNTTGNAQIDLFGNGSDADVTLGSGATGTADVAVDLFGNGSAGDSTGGVDVGGGLLGGTGGTGGAGGVGGSGGSGAPIDIFGNGSGGSSGNRVASINSTACLTPNVQQTAKLVGRHQYTAQTVTSWNGITQIRIVDARLCKGVGASLATDPNIARLQTIIAKSPAIRASLAEQGHSTGDVIAVDRSGNALLVYVG